MLEALASPMPRLAANVSAYGLSVPLAMESGSLVTLLRRILAPDAAAEQPHGSYSDGQVACHLTADFLCSQQRSSTACLDTPVDTLS